MIFSIAQFSKDLALMLAIKDSFNNLRDDNKEVAKVPISDNQPEMVNLGINHTNFLRAEA